MGAADHKEHGLDESALGESPTGVHSREKRRPGSRNSKKKKNITSSNFVTGLT